MEFSEIGIKIKKDTTRNLAELLKKPRGEVGIYDLCESKSEWNGKIISICLTVYNENEADFISTFFSLIKSIKHATRSTTEEYQYVDLRSKPTHFCVEC